MVLRASDFDKSPYLRAEDLKAEKKFRIKTVTAEVIGGKKEKKLVVWFTNDERGLVLNKTNNRTLRDAFGDDNVAKDWADKVIIIFPTMGCPTSAKWCRDCVFASHHRNRRRLVMVKQ